MAANNPLFDFSQPRVMAILNVTPDSFFAGSRMPCLLYTSDAADEL